MNESKYYNYIDERLSTLAVQIDSNGKLNVLYLNNHAEQFYRELFNKIFDWNLKNLNIVKQNVEAIDLCCDEKGIIIQVSATCTKEKIESALMQNIIEEYKKKNYCFKFISISKDASKLRKKVYNNPFNINFNPSGDIYDLTSIKKVILNLDLDHKIAVYEFIKKALGNEINIEKLDSNLASVVNILSEEDLNEDNQPILTNPFDIERKIIFNNLNAVKDVIDDYSIYHSRLNGIYDEFDKSGKNKSNSVLKTIKWEYSRNLDIKDDSELFLLIIKKIKDKVIQSPNFYKIPTEELEVCVDIIVVDAFMRCKIFKNPENYKYVAA
ncbi:MAG: ABC-three component system protein [Minisyncoccales bacterium]